MWRNVRLKLCPLIGTYYLSPLWLSFLEHLLMTVPCLLVGFPSSLISRGWTGHQYETEEIQLLNSLIEEVFVMISEQLYRLVSALSTNYLIKLTVVTISIC